MTPVATTRIALRHLASGEHEAQVALMKFLSSLSKRLGVARDVYVVGGAVRNFIINQPIKDIDVVIDSVSSGRDSEWFAKQLLRAIPVPSNLTTNQYGVAILTVKGPWVLDGHDLQGEVIEIANARTESYGGGDGKGYKPSEVTPATIGEDVYRREFTFNTLMWRMLDLADGPDRAEIIDLTGCGKSDLAKRELRCPRDPDVVFADDPTRILRAIKFVAKYGFKIPPDLAQALGRNAGKMKNAPWEAIGKILVENVLNEPTAGESLRLMKKLGLLDVIADMVRENKPFATYLSGQLNNQRVALLLDLLDLGLEVKSPVSFLSRDQQIRLRAITTSMPTGKAEEFLALLQKPPVDNMALINEFSIPPKDRGSLSPKARELILDQPDLAFDPAQLQENLRREISKMFRLATDKIPGGISDKKPVSDFDKKLIEQGADVEMEHTDDRDLAREIARDHLAEDLDYYEKLKKVEKKASVRVAKYEGINFVPPQSVADEAEKGLEYRAKSGKGGLTNEEASEQGIGSGVQRATNLKNRDKVSPEVIRKMVGFFSRHEKNKSVSAENKNTPWEDAGYVAWLLWGGDSGKAWANEILEKMETEDNSKNATTITMTVKNASASDGKKTGDGSSVVLMIPLPEELASQFPKGEKDKTPKHITFVYVGKVPEEREEELREVLTRALSGVRGPIRAALNGVGTFTSQDGRVVYSQIRFSEDMSRWNQVVRDALTDSGFEVNLSFPVFTAHSTIAYLGPDETWEGVPPAGSWFFDEVEVWGARTEMKIPLGIEKPSLPPVGPETGARRFSSLMARRANSARLNHAWRKRADSFSRLVMYDFDGTLFRSWEAVPEWWKGSELDSGPFSFFVRPESLDEPCVPDDPSSDYWVSPVLQSAREDSRNPNVVSVLITGRTGIHKARVKELLRSKGVNFTHLYFNPGLDSARFKTVVLKNLLAGYNTVSEVEVWENENEKIYDSALRRTSEAFGRDIEVTVHHIRERAIPLDCGPEDFGLDENHSRLGAATYKNKKKIKGPDGEERVVYEYSEHQSTRRNNEKAKRIEALRNSVEDLRKAYRSGLDSKDPKERLTALAVALLDLTFERVGNDASAENGHYGVTNWEKKHIKINGDKATFTYVGKSGVDHVKVVEDKKVVSEVKKALEGKKDDERLLCEGDDCKVSASDVNSFLEEFDVTAKDIRGLHANEQMKINLKKNRKGALPKDKKEREEKLKEEFKKALEATAEEVGHEASTLRSQYLVPSLEDTFMKDGTIIEKLHEKKGTKTRAEKEDEAAADLVRTSPRNKPPRTDLENRTLSDEDEDPDEKADQKDREKTALLVVTRRERTGSEPPPFVDYDEAYAWIQERAKEFGGIRPYAASPEYHRIAPQIQALYKVQKAKNDSKVKAEFAKTRIRDADRVEHRSVGAFLTPVHMAGTIEIRGGVPYVKIDPNPFTHRKRIRWDSRWQLPRVARVEQTESGSWKGERDQKVEYFEEKEKAEAYERGETSGGGSEDEKAGKPSPAEELKLKRDNIMKEYLNRGLLKEDIEKVLTKVEKPEDVDSALDLLDENLAERVEKVKDDPTVDMIRPVPDDDIPLEGDALDRVYEEALTRARETVSKYTSEKVDAAKRSQDWKKLTGALEGLEENSPKRIHLEAIRRGIGVAAALMDGDEAQGVGSVTARLAQAAKKSGNLDSLLRLSTIGSSEAGDEEDQGIVRSIYTDLDDNDWDEILDSDHPAKPLAELLADSEKSRFMTEEDKASIREMMTDMMVAEAVFLDPAGTRVLGPEATVGEHDADAKDSRSKALPEREVVPTTSTKKIKDWLSEFVQNLSKNSNGRKKTDKNKSDSKPGEKPKDVLDPQNENSNPTPEEKKEEVADLLKIDESAFNDASDATSEDLDAFQNNPVVKGLKKGFNLHIIADGKVDKDGNPRPSKGDLRRAAHVAAVLQAGIDKSADYCKVNKPACSGNLGITRDNMPQIMEKSVAELNMSDDERINKDGAKFFSGALKKKVPWAELTSDEQEGLKKDWAADRKKAKAAIDAGANPNETRSTQQVWLDNLKSEGIAINEDYIPVGKLIASQAEIKAGKTYNMAKAYLTGEWPDMADQPILVARDPKTGETTVIDGHHRYAGLLTADPNKKMKVRVIEAPIREALEKSFDVPGVFRADLQDNIVDSNKPLDLARKPGSVWQQKGKWYGKNKDKKTEGPFADRDKAEEFAT